MAKSKVPNFRIAQLLQDSVNDLKVQEVPDGTLVLALTQCQKGQLTLAFQITCHREGNELVSEVRDGKGVVVATCRTTP
jgi:hypothetical protein